MFDDILLTAREKCVLFKMRFGKKSKLQIADIIRLSDYGLIVPNYTGEQNSIGERITDGTYRLSDKYIRYRIYKRRDFYRRLVLPITVTLLTEVAIQLIRWL